MYQEFSSDQRKVYDIIYGFINFPKEIWQFIDTPHFQRLRNIKQLDCYWAYPSAIHTRFQHSLGTGYLARKYIKTLITKHYHQDQKKQKKINQVVYDAYSNQQTRKKAIFTVTLAGVLHDVGHGPFSHLFDNKVVKKANGKDWEHEIASLSLIEDMYKYVLNNSNKSQKDKEWLKSTLLRVKCLIIGKIIKSVYNKNKKQFEYPQVDNLQEDFKQKFKEQLKERCWEFQIVSNRLNGIDVDKLDYFRRDAFYIGEKNIFIDHDLLMNETLILTDPYIQQDNLSLKHRICYPSKYSDKVYDVFYSRYKLYKSYHNFKSNGVKLMIGDILKQSQKYFKFKNSCQQLLKGNSQKYIQLTDSIIQKIQDAYKSIEHQHQEFLTLQKMIQNLKQKSQPQTNNHSNQDEKQIIKGVHDFIKQKMGNQNQKLQQIQGLRRAHGIIERLKKRQTYYFLIERHNSYSFNQLGNYNIDKKQIQTMSQILQKAYNDEIIIDIFQAGYGIKDKNPFNECKFYEKYQEQKRMLQHKQSDNQLFSMLKSQKIIQLYVCIYLKKKQQWTSEKIQELENMFYQKFKHINGKFISSRAGVASIKSKTLCSTANMTKVNLQEV